MMFLFSKLISVGVWNEEDGGISYYNMMEHLDKHCGVEIGKYASSEGYVSEPFSVGESALDILMEAWNKDTNGKQLICPVGGARSFIFCFHVHKTKLTERR